MYIDSGQHEIDLVFPLHGYCFQFRHKYSLFILMISKTSTKIKGHFLHKNIRLANILPLFGKDILLNKH